MKGVHILHIYYIYLYKYLGHLGIYVLEIILYCIAGQTDPISLKVWGG